MADILLWNQFDLIYMQRELLPFGPPILERWLSKNGARLIFDFDDALFIQKPSSVSRLPSFWRSKKRIQEIIKISDAVVAGNKYLKSQAEAEGARAFVLEVAEDTKRISMRPPHVNRDNVIIGWLGSRSTEKYLQLLTPVFKEFFDRFSKGKLLVVGGGEYCPDDLPVEHVPWSYRTEIAELHRFDIGIMPLPIEDWSRGKCGGKARTYMAAGIPAVVQDIGYNQELIQHGETGFLVPDHAQSWLDVLTLLTKNPGLRQSVGEKARAEVKERFSLEGITDQMAAILMAEFGRR